MSDENEPVPPRPVSPRRRLKTVAPSGVVEEPVAPTAEPSRGTEALKKHWAIRAATILIPVLASSLFTLWSASREAKEKAQAAKNRAEAGFQEVDKVTDGQKQFNAGVAEQLQELKIEIAKLRDRQLRPAPRRVVKPAAKVEPVTPPPPLPTAKLSPNLDKALEQAQAKSAQTDEAKAPPSPPDGGQKR